MDPISPYTHSLARADDFHRSCARRLVVWICLCLGAFSCFALGLDDTPLIRTSGQSENLIKFDPDNAAAPGLSIEVMRAIERIDPALKFVGQEVLRPVSRIDLELEAGSLDVFFGLVRNQARQEKYVVLSAPLYRQFTQLAVRGDDPIEIQTFDEIRTLGGAGVVGVPRGSAYVEQLKALGGLVVDDGAVSVENTLKKLLKGRVRFVYYGGTVLRKQLHKDGLEGRIKLIPTRFNREDVCIVVSRKTEPKLATRIEQAVQRMRGSGELSAIQEKYGVRD
ncbi:substrate-binding periplasmic protein [Roseateles koreensis]|uniref:Transporter substrate-binding domain-containing protein n=1 Tax=Roseateles koreensis TaxID=2987526 RepID=A0ABT5KNL4_9BURK|nr:transporter substrate-binding domain-containing protein [Roseateles koreensis]MDC8784504.1 transporter substrate-binding domain-containing protein [Roseateles koreensis]